jgi:phytoene dehydrogenase-like protein
MNDAIIIGGGLNGLTAAGMLARGGMKVLLLESRAEFGGSAVTGEFAPGFKTDLVRHDIGTLPVDLWRQLDLEKHGWQMLSSNPEILAPGSDGSALLLEAGRPGTPSDSLKKLSPSDAAKWPEFTRKVAALAGFLEHLYRAPMPGVDASGFAEMMIAARIALKLRGLGKADMVEVLRVLPMSVGELVEDTFEHPVLRGVLASRGLMHLAQGPRAAATAFTMLHHQVGRHPGAFRTSMRPVGGVGALAAALVSSARAAGAELRANARVAKIAMRGGAVSSVVLESGEEIAATRVVSEVSPRHTFTTLCDPSQLDPELVRAVSNIRYRGVTAKVHLALDALPGFRGAPESARPARSVVIAPSLDYLDRAYDDSKYGRVSAKPWLDVFIPTIDDPSFAPAGKHVMSVQVQYAPYKLRDAGEGAGPSGITEWNAASRDQLADHVIRTLAEYAPELPGLVRHRHVLTPLDLEEQYGLPEGNPYHGELALDQALFMRPVPACSRYRTPVPGLWLCGSGGHPGGGIPGRAGANAAKQIQGDARR